MTQKLTDAVEIFERICELLDQEIDPEMIPAQLDLDGHLPEPWDVIWSRQHKHFSIIDDGEVIVRLDADGEIWT